MVESQVLHGSLTKCVQRSPDSSLKSEFATQQQTRPYIYLRTPPLPTLHPNDRHLRMFTARAMTNATVTSATADWIIIVNFAQRDSGNTSVGLKAVALVKDT